MEYSTSRTAFVTGMPRSRTAWFANYLTYSDSFFYHDPLFQFVPSDMFAKIKHSDYLNSGISDAGLILYWEQFRDAFPNAKWIVIERRFDEVKESCGQITPVNEGRIRDMRRKLDELIAELEPMRVAFDEITPQVAMSIADYCGVDAGNMDRAEMLCDFNIQIHPPVLKARLKKLAQKNETVLA